MATKQTKKKGGPSTKVSEPQLCVEVVISGIWSAINANNKGGSAMLGPSVIAVRAEDKALGIPEHLTYLAIDRKQVKVTGLGALRAMPMAGDFLHIPLDGQVVTIDGHAPASPKVQNSFRSVARIGDYWPAGNRLPFKKSYVPDAKSEPDPACVSAYFRFGNGRLGANNITPGEWTFRGKGEPSPPAQDYYAQAITYCFETPGPSITIRIRDLKKPGSEKYVLTITPTGTHLQIHLGNSMPADIPHILLRDEGMSMMTPHWIALHKVKGVPPSKDAPLPKPAMSTIGTMSPTGGLCGPGYGGP